ncbi:hypothetical protein ACLQ2Y_31955 [Micromonospora echinospora]|uniref:hypothetical protein n=1 Tax=Micromonospora echinospora TaxID=1877 RepID=UPI003CFBA3FE
MADTSWVPVASAGVGAVIALAGTVVAGVRADRAQRSRDRESERLATYVDFAAAIHDAHSALRDVVRTVANAEERSIAAGQALQDSKVYSTRERLLMSATIEMAKASESVFFALVAIRDAVRSGTELSGTAYHDAYHAYADAIWKFRIAARQELSQRPIAPADLNRISWSEREECPVCGRTVASV